MNFAFNDEQEQLRDTVRRFCEQRSPATEVRRLMETDAGYDDTMWKQLATELGLQGLAIPEGYGGHGFGVLELVVVFEEMGRALACPALYSTLALGANAVLEAGTEEQKQRLLPPIAAGESIATLALAEPGSTWDPAAIACTARASGDGFVLDGEKSYVTDGHVADLVVVAARDADTGEIGLYAVDGSDVERTLLDSLDLTRKLARVHLDGAEAERLGDAGQATLERVLDLAVVLLCAEMVGGAQWCLDAAVAYAKERHQFGRPIGSFQAVKHRCADMLVELESARSAAYYAGWAASTDAEDLPVVASLAKAYCSDAYTFCAEANVFVLGGIGFTWEHDAHLYVRRAKSSELLFGDAVYHRELIARRSGW